MLKPQDARIRYRLQSKLHPVRRLPVGQMNHVLEQSLNDTSAATVLNDMQIDEKRCRQSEADARDQLKRDWASFPAANRSQCITTATMGGTASYVELITCLEMLNDVAGLPASKDSKETLRTKPTGLGPQR